MTGPLKVFLSYAHEDEAHRETLGKHLSALEREGLIQLWHDRRITGGREWAGAIDGALRSADIVLFPISADFLDSDYCNDVEPSEAVHLHDAGRIRVVPVILRSCGWEQSRIARFRALPSDGTPAVEATHPDQRFKEIPSRLLKNGQRRTRKKLTTSSDAPQSTNSWEARVKAPLQTRKMALENSFSTAC